MRKNTKGFTLIELLAVIVILAVIALIATPIIMNVINDAKDGANKDAAYGIVKAIETAMAQESVKNPSYTPVTTAAAFCDGSAAATPADGKVTVCGVTATYKGTNPNSIVIKLDKTAVTAGTTVTFGSKTYTMGADGKFGTN